LSTFNLKIFTPLAKVFDEEVVSLVAPGELGHLGILAHHAPLITSLAPGQLKVTASSGKEFRYQLEGGILKVENNRAVLLAETVEPID